MDLSNEAEARSLVSGENSTSLTSALWPVILARGFLSSAGFHKNKVKSSEPDTKRSGAEPCGMRTGVRALIQEGTDLNILYQHRQRTILTLTLLYLCKAFSFSSSTEEKQNACYMKTTH